MLVAENGGTLGPDGQALYECQCPNLKWEGERCENILCQNGGSKGASKLWCKCLNDYTGRHCEKKNKAYWSGGGDGIRTH